ncbi:DUF1990 family protein [Phaeacidiphilus oryzae]|jgi:uncharacterized protein (UPF0548 family)|uniref:DUF1990 family protein n=1 Tax=Phaeacidiphilus oryzae TaxID=348818 RepID=UPI00056041EC|nr:DUF1990 domain-containing protein [Phaeacidiphilus oryzae]
MAGGLTYPEVGATRGELPGGYRWLAHRSPVGRGRERFEEVGERILDWRMHRAVGVGVRATADRAAPGVRLEILLGRGRFGVTAPCEVVWTLREPNRVGFAYGTLPGHPECGEESFVAELDPDGTCWFTLTAFSRPAAWYTRAAGPLVPVFQRLYARRCAWVLRHR